MSRITRRGRRIAALAAAFTLASPLALSAHAAPTIKVDESTKTYIVQLDEDPIASYDGGVAEIPATSPAPGEKVDVTSRSARAYEAHLRRSQRKALREAGVTDNAKVHEFTVAFNGFTAKLTDAQAAEVAKATGVINVWVDEIRHADTITTPDYLGMTGYDGVWARQFDGPDNAGKGLIIGVLDTGIDPNNPSFAPLADGAARPEGFACETENDADFTCTNKIVGARYYGAAYGNDIAYDHNSPRDTNGHGSHTAATAGGNHDVPVVVQGNELGKASGMAPMAQIAVYKGLWQTVDGRGSGTTSGLVAAIDDATTDGVDVINYSVSGSSQYVVTPDELAFMGAAEAGIFVATSAGNSGDTVGVSSVAHNSPWTMTVAASTHDRSADKTVALGNGATYEGVGVGVGVGPAPVVYAGDIALDGVDALAARECWLDADAATEGDQPALDPARAAGRIVLCDRGSVARVDKSAAVKVAGGVGMIQRNMTAAQSLNADFHSVPSIHVSAADGEAILAYVQADANPTATLSETGDAKVDAPSMAGFSSYGPALAGEGDLIKPDITAPGVDVLAAISADPETGEARFDQMSGTSMSAPHIAGLGTLLKQKFPTWSPMAIKSAMMTTARQTTDAGQPIAWGTVDATPLNFGSGEVVPTKSYNPGLVYDSNVRDWLAYACGIGQLQMIGEAETCSTVPDTDPSDLNYPSIGIGKLAGSQTVTRTVTNVTRQALQYRASVEAPPGTTVSVTPSRITLRPGGSAVFKVTITRTDAALGDYTFGSLTWVPSSSRYNAVRSPIAVRPVAVSAPGEVRGTTVEGTADLSVTPGFSGTMGTDLDGLLESTTLRVDARKVEGSVFDGVRFFSVPSGTRVTRVATWADEVEANDIDVTLYRLNADFTVSAVGSSGNGDSTESITARDLTPGTYVIGIDVFDGANELTVPIHLWNLGDTDPSNLGITPAQTEVVQGRITDFTVGWHGLDNDKHYLGQVSFLAPGGGSGSALISVDT